MVQVVDDKRMKARKVFICTTFGLFTGGLKKFDEYYENGIIDRVLTTNLVYQTPELLSKQPNILASQGAACNIGSKSTISHRNLTMMKAESFARVPEIKKCLSFSEKFPVKDRHSYIVT